MVWMLEIWVKEEVINETNDYFAGIEKTYYGTECGVQWRKKTKK